MKRFILFLVCFLLSFSIVYAQEDGFDFTVEKIEFSALDDVAEEDFDGMWIPVLQYLRYFNDVVPITSSYENDFILINTPHIYVTLLGNFFPILPYKFDENAVLTAIFPGTENEISITLRLIDDNLMLYTLATDGGIVRAEFIYYRADAESEAE